MPSIIETSSNEHKQAASDHEHAARQHRAAAEFYDKCMGYAARLSSEGAMECCLRAHRHSMLACEHSAGKAS